MDIILQSRLAMKPPAPCRRSEGQSPRGLVSKGAEMEELVEGEEV